MDVHFKSLKVVVSLAPILNVAAKLAKVTQTYVVEQYLMKKMNFHFVITMREGNEKMIRCANECAEVHSNICCYDCEKNKQCSDPCEMPMSECNDLIIENEADGLKVFALAQDDLVSELLEVVRDKKSLEEEEKKLKKEIKKFMEKCSIRKYKGQGVDINYIEGTTSKGIDSKKLKEKYPEIAEECVKEISKDSYIKVVVKK